MQRNTDNAIKNTHVITNHDLQFKGGIAALVIAFAYMICNTLLKPDRLLNPVKRQLL
jgi:hypothetical protein